MAKAKFDHIAIAVWSIREALPLLEVIGARFVVGNDDDKQQIRTIQFVLPPGVKIELMEPLAETSFLHAFLEKHGPGFHHSTMLFDDIEALIPQMNENGFDVVNTNLSDPAWRDTWARPSKAFGALLQLADTTMDWLEPCEFTLDEVLAGEVIWNGNARVRRDDV